MIEVVQLQVELPFDGADLLGGSLEPLAGGGEGKAGIALKELGVQLLFQLADLAGEGLLGDVEALGGAGDVHLLGHDKEVLQVLKIHAALLLPIIRKLVRLYGIVRPLSMKARQPQKEREEGGTITKKC